MLHDADCGWRTMDRRNRLLLLLGCSRGFPVRARGGRGGAGPATDAGVESGRGGYYGQ